MIGYAFELPVRNIFTCPKCGENKFEAYYAATHGVAHYNNIKGISLGYRKIEYTDIEDFKQKLQEPTNINHCTCFTCGKRWKEYRKNKRR